MADASSNTVLIRRPAKRLMFTDALGGSLHRMQACWRLGIDLAPGIEVRGSGVPLDWGDTPPAEEVAGGEIGG